jgi:hypothetical protein
MPVTEVVEYAGSIAIFGVAKLDHLSKLSAFESRATLDVGEINLKLCSRRRIEHDNAATSARVFSRSRLTGRLSPGGLSTGTSLIG